MFLLQELYVRRGLPPKYDLVHDPTFMYRVTIGEFEATGCGQSKKKAKQSAIQALQKILIGAQNSGKALECQMYQGIVSLRLRVCLSVCLSVCLFVCLLVGRC